MPLTPAQVVALVDACLEKYPEFNEPIASARKQQLRNIRAFLLAHGFPKSDDDRCRLSLIPLLHRELTYEGIHWLDQNVELGRLADHLQIDFLVHSGGHLRDDVKFLDFNRYLIFTSGCQLRWARREFTLSRSNRDPTT
jgi:hypothetical protein